MRYKNEFLAALLKELDLFTATFQPGTPEKEPGEKQMPGIETIYIGGGTPSLLEKTEIKTIIEKISAVFPVLPGAEITLEANPDDISDDKLRDWKEAGINRLSIGVQSFFEEDLVWMNRAHSAKQAIEGLEAANREFSNITIDLIYGTPQLTNEKWKSNVDKAISLGVTHLSCYALTVEPRTALDKMIRQQKSPEIDAPRQSEQFLLLMEWMKQAGYEHYEISNFAKPGFRSRHNSSYWQGKNYYGFGPSAHSFDGKTRWWNIANNNTYIQSIQQGRIPSEKEELTGTQKINEYIMISLRTMEGLDLDKFDKLVNGAVTDNHEINNQQFRNQFNKKAEKYIERELMIKKNNFLVLTNEGKLLADGIAADLFADQ